MKIGQAVCISLVSVILFCSLCYSQNDAKNIEYENVIGPQGLEWANKKLIEQTDSNITGFDQIKEVQYMRLNIPDLEKPIPSGKTYESYVPDTIDLERRAALTVKYFTRQCMPQADYEVTCHVVLGTNPPRSGLNAGGGCIWPKFMESLPLMRYISGNMESLEVDKKWAEVILHSIGPDGLSYWPLVGRPWDAPGALGTDKAKDPYRGWFHMNIGRLLGAISVYYEITGDKRWLEEGKKIVDGLDTVAVKIDDKAVSFDWYYSPTYKMPQNAHQKAKEFLDSLVKGDTLKSDVLNWGQTLYTTWVVTGLSQFYRVSNYEPSLDWAKRFARVLRYQYPDDGSWYGHQHCGCLVIHCFCELAEATGDLEWAKFAKKMYEWAKRNDEMGAIPELGFFPCHQEKRSASAPQNLGLMEPCSIADMTAIACKLTKLGVGDFYDDIDAYVRNELMEVQITGAYQLNDFLEKLKKRGECPDVPAPYNYLTDNLSERFEGFFPVTTRVNDLFYYTWGEMCCTGNCSRALFYSWERIAEYSDGKLKINLLLNRTTQWADVFSYLPYQGKVEIDMKKSCDLSVRLNSWIDKNSVICKVDGKKKEFKFNGNYIDIGKVKKDRLVCIEFPILEYTKEVKTAKYKYKVIFRGADAVRIEPADSGNIGLFKRDIYRSSVPRYIKVARFVPAVNIEH